MIESLNSPHVGRVKALISSRGAKERSESGSFIAEGIQCIKEALASKSGPQLQTIYITNSAFDKYQIIGFLVFILIGLIIYLTNTYSFI